MDPRVGGSYREGNQAKTGNNRKVVKSYQNKQKPDSGIAEPKAYSFKRLGRGGKVRDFSILSGLFPQALGERGFTSMATLREAIFP